MELSNEKYNFSSQFNIAFFHFNLSTAYFFIMKNCLRICLLFLTINAAVSTCQIFAQNPYFIPAKEAVSFSETTFTFLEENYKQTIANLPSQDKKDLAKVYKERWDYIGEKFTEKEIYFEKEARKYLESIVTEITRANPALQKQSFQCFFSKSGIPNASYLGEGLILFNMGLFTRLENESQAAFIICHELAHYQLRHSEKSIESYVATINSKEVQRELKNIKNAEYGKRAVLEDLLKGLTFNSRRHGRMHESEADSMATEFLKNTRYEITEALKTLALLDAIDADILQMENTLQGMFDFKEYPFRKKWIAKESGLLGGHAVLETDEKFADSLKTHPDCQKRIEILEPLIKKYESTGKTLNPVSGEKFRELSQRFRYEIIEHSFIAENYSRSLLFTLKLLKKQPEDPYLITQVGRIFNELYEAQKKHTLGKVTDLPAPYFDADYNLLLQFIQNLYREDFAAIGYHFLNQYSKKFETFAAFKTTYQTSLTNFN